MRYFLQNDMPRPARVYLAGKFETRQTLIIIRGMLEATGEFAVVASWLNEPGNSPSGFAKSQLAGRDLADIDEADLFILDTTEDNSRAGREVEYGYALGKDIPLIVVGPRRNVFHELADEQFATWSECLAYLGAQRSDAG